MYCHWRNYTILVIKYKMYLCNYIVYCSRDGRLTLKRPMMSMDHQDHDDASGASIHIAQLPIIIRRYVIL